MSKEQMKLALEHAKRDERHLNHAETRYWCRMYRDIAEKAVEALAKPDFWEGYVPEPVKPAPMTKDEAISTERALDLALEALEELQPDDAYPYSLQSKAITAIKQARSAPVQEPVAIVDEDGVIVVCNYKYKPGDKLYTTPPAAPVPEPVAFNAGVPPLYPEMKDGETISVEYTTPPAAQRQWVGLTDEEYIHITDSVYHKGQGLVAYYKAIEAKLKEKNNG